MTAYAEHATIHHGDCLNTLAELDDNSVDAVVTDPPYGLEFMGKDWDAPWKTSSDVHAQARVYRSNEMEEESKRGKAFQQWCQQWAAECLRVLKPGGHMVAFGGTRTWHRLACAIEDAGFEIRDTLSWIYGSGFPKSLDVSKAIDKAAGAERDVVGRRSDGAARIYDMGAGDRLPSEIDITAPATPDAARWPGWGTALKPAYEPIVLARKPLSGTVAGNVLAYGTGALNVDGCRVGMSDSDRKKFVRGDAAWREMSEKRAKGRKDNEVYGEYGITNSDPHPGGRWPANVVLDPVAAAMLDGQSGESVSKASAARNGVDDGGTTWNLRRSADDVRGHSDTGGASRFFYTAKADAAERPRHGATAHPTVKPLDLMRWLVRLVTPPGGTVLDPFAGSGATVEACILEGFHCVAIERETDYLPLIMQRIHRRLDPVAHHQLTTTDDEDPSLFDLLAQEGETS